MSEQLDLDAVVANKFDQMVSGMYINPEEKISSQTFTLFPNYVEAKLGNIKKSISLLDFKAIIDGLLNVDSKMTQLSLPFNCYTFGKSSNEIRLGCYHPERIMEIKHIDRSSGKPKAYTVPLPNVIVSSRLTLKEGVWAVQDTKYFCTNKKVTQLPEDNIIMEADKKNGIWLMPFPNFYGDGRMCYGRNTMPTRYSNNLRGLDYFYQVIFESPFNDDLGIPGISHTRSPANWFKELAALTQFPYEKLSGAN